MKKHKEILQLAIEGKLPNKISEDDFPDIDIFDELYQSGLIKAIDGSTFDGKAFINPKITLEGREYYEELKQKTAQPITINKSESEKVFISYVRENFKEVDRICDVFKENNINFWLDRNDIEPGKIWKSAIENAINNGAFFLACFSKEYNLKIKTYMNEELLTAVAMLRIRHYDSGWFIPIKLSDCEIPPLDIGASKSLQDLHYLNFYEEWDVGINRLIDYIKQEEDTDQLDSSKDYFEKEYNYRGLKSLIESGDGAGFHNTDMGHPVYTLGASDASEETIKYWEYADSPKKNRLFKMISKLSKELKAMDPDISTFTWWYDFSEWKDFCKFAINVYYKKRKQ